MREARWPVERRRPLPGHPSLTDIGARRSAAELERVIRQAVGRMPSYPNMPAEELRALVTYLRTGQEPQAPQPRQTAVSPVSDEEPRVRAGSQGPTALGYRFTGYRKFLDPDGYPATAPPWGTLNAINLNTGEFVWKVPLGQYPALAEKGLTDTGSENSGGPVVTAGGLVFIATTNFDRKVRAFDKDTGKLLWEAMLPFSGNATPATYEVNGRQFLVVPAGGGKSRDPSGGVYVAFALPQGQAAVVR